MISKIKKFVLNHKAIVLILGIAVFMRTAMALELFMYSHDQDLLSWFVKDIVVNKNLRLIGQETSVHGVFIGPLFYYAAVPFYLLWGMNPVGGIALSTLIGAASCLSIFYVFSKAFSRRAGYIGMLLYAVSFYVVMTDREVVPTTPVILWSIWFLYALHLFNEGKTKSGLLLSGILVGLIWHLNLALLLVTPLLLISFFQSKNRFKLRDLKWPLTAFFGLNAPLILFELRHQFSQVTAVVTQFGAPAAFPQSHADKFDRLIQLLEKNLGSIWGTSLVDIPRRPVLYALPILILILIYTKKISGKMAVLIVTWIALFLFFFTVNSLNLSEYYLNGLVVVFLLILTLVLEGLWTRAIYRPLAILFIAIYAWVNISTFFNQPINRSGYLDRTAIINEIGRDAKLHGYPCVAVSYITEPGSNFGYRYLFYRNNVKANLPKTEAPVYTIVFPHTLVGKIDTSFGALGLLYPDYQKYTTEGIEKSCSGPDQNLSEPLFGYTE